VYALFPFAEEPWLREQYGQEYDEYRKRISRFIGRDLVKKLITR